MRHNMLIRIDIQIHQPQERLDNGGFAITSSSNYLDPLASGEARLTEAELELADGWIQIHQPQERLDFRNSSHIHTLSNLDPLASGEARQDDTFSIPYSNNLDPLASGEARPQKPVVTHCISTFRSTSLRRGQTLSLILSNPCLIYLDPLASGEARLPLTVLLHPF